VGEARAGGGSVYLIEGKWLISGRTGITRGKKKKSSSALHDPERKKAGRVQDANHKLLGKNAVAASAGLRPSEDTKELWCCLGPPTSGELVWEKREVEKKKKETAEGHN